MTASERKELLSRAHRKDRLEESRKAQLILMLAEGESYLSIQKKLSCAATYVARWRKRFEADRLAGLYPRYQGPRASVLTPELEAQILSASQKTPPDGSTHWSTRKLGRHLGINHMLVHRAWLRAGVQPQIQKVKQQISDPAFEGQSTDIVGLYLKPPQHAAVFCLSKRTTTEECKGPYSDLRTKRTGGCGFEFYQDGTLSLFLTLCAGSAEIPGRAARRHTAAEFVAFLEDIVVRQPSHHEMHLFADHLSTQKTRRVRDFLWAHPSVTSHYTPTYSSWLNQIESLFSKIKGDLTARGWLTLVKDLDQKLMRYIRQRNLDSKAFKWSFRDPLKQRY